MTFAKLLRSALVALFVLCGMAVAQDTAKPDYEAWETRATVAESTLERGLASTQSLETMRAQVAEWREDFLSAQGTNAGRIQTLQAQLDALGPKPEEGTESEDIASRRAELTQQLQALRAPVVRAEEAFTRADGIISQIDGMIRERQTRELLELGPTPLNPELWAPALTDLTNTLWKSGNELRLNFGSEIAQAQLKRSLPLVVLLTVVGLVLIAQGGNWARRGVEVLRGDARRGSGVWRFLISLGQILLPLAGIYALTEAAAATGLFGTRWSVILNRLPEWAAVLLGIRWLADRAFHEDDEIAAIGLEPAHRRRARYLAKILAVMYVLRDVLEALTAQDGYALGSIAVLAFPMLVISGLLLARLGQVRDAAPEDPSDGAFRRRIALTVGQAATALGLLGPVLAAIGYLNIGEAMVYPAIATLALFGLVLVLQVFFNDVYLLATGTKAEEADNLVPVLVSFLLILASLPFLALIWGARVADLTELWARTQEGFQFGDSRISPTDFLIGIAVFAAGVMLTRLAQGALRTSVLPRTKLDQGGKTAVVSGVGYLGIFLAVIIGVTTGGVDLSSLAIVAGALSVGIGFGLQTIVSNFVSGIILLIERPISAGDWIEVGGVHGIVREISVRATRVETFDKFDVIVPNADLIAGQVRNYTRGNVLGRVIIPVGVAYGTDTRKVEKILLGIAREHDMVLMNPAPYVYFKGFGADALDFEIRAILRDVNSTISVRTQMNHQIAERFAEEGIEIPFAQRDIWLRNPEALAPAAAPETSGTEAQGTGQQVASAGAGAGERPGQQDAAEDGEDGGEAVGRA